MPAPKNGPRQGISTGRNRLTVQNIASKGGNIYTALNRDRTTGIGGQLNKAPKPQVQEKKPGFKPTASLDKMKAIRQESSKQLTAAKTPGAVDYTQATSDYMAALANAGQQRASLTAMALLARARSGSGGSGRGVAPSSAPAVGRLQELAQRLAARKQGWGGDKQWAALQELVQRESSWNPQADNPTSTAYGLFQFLDSTRQNYGLGLNAKPRQQIIKGLQYIADRYGDPRKALRFHDRNNYY